MATPSKLEGGEFWDEFDSTEMSITHSVDDRGRTAQRSLPQVSTGGQSLYGDSQLRQRQTTPSPGRSDFTVLIDEDDANYSVFLNLLENDLKTFYPNTNIRNLDQLYYQMIPDTLLQNKSHESFRVRVYWIKTEHLYWKVLDNTYKDACVLAKMQMSKDSAMLAIGQEYMDEVVHFLWKRLYDSGRTYKTIHMDHDGRK